LFSFDLKNGAYNTLYAFKGGDDGFYPDQPLVALKGNIYGTTKYGGSNHCHQKQGCGTIFKLNLATGLETVLDAFPAGITNDSAIPAITRVGDKLYGTAGRDRAAPYGDILRLQP